MSDDYLQDIYRSPKNLSYLAIGGLAIVLILDLLIVIFGFGENLFPQQVELDTGEMESIWLLFIGLVALVRIPIYVLTAVFFLTWLYRANKNLPALKSYNPEYTPGWVIGAWFIPFANLVFPFQAVREVWNMSNPDFDPELGFLSSDTGTEPIIGMWWGTFIITNITTRISSRVETVSDPLFPLVIVASFLSVIAAVLAIMVVRGITARQEARFSRLVSLQVFSPPPPPKF